MHWDEGLQGQALAIAACNRSPLRVMAGPGTGKSFSMKRRIHRLLEEHVEGSKILAVTFTKTAAQDIEKELSQLKVPGCEEILTGTLHSFCFSLLIKQRVLQYLKRYPRTLITYNNKGISGFEMAPLIEDIKLEGNFGTKREICNKIRAFESAWARLQSDIPGWPVYENDKRFHNELIRWLKFHNAMLIGEVIPETLKYLRNNPEAEELNMFKHVVVDEYQDLNKAEQVLIDLLSANSETFIIGDEDQSIYSFKYAHPEGIRNFKESHPETHDEPLDECRRCPKKVVTIANNLILENHPPETPHRLIEKKDNKEGNIYIVQWKDLNEEVQELASYINYLIKNKGINEKDILILSSRRLIGYELLTKLKELSINVHCYFYEAVLENTDGQKSFTLLSLLNNIEDPVSMRFWIGLDSAKWNANEYKKIRCYAADNNIALKTVLDGILEGTVSLPKINKTRSKYQELLGSLEKLKKMSTAEVFDSLFPDNVDWAVSIRKIIKAKIVDETTIKELFEEIKTFITQPEVPEGDFARIMSLHKSKGLTSRVVIIPSILQGLLPGLNEKLEQHEQELNLQEQRRLFYVGITRSTEILVLSTINKMLIKDAKSLGALGQSRIDRYNQRNVTSQFLHELGPSAPKMIKGDVWKKNNYI